MNLISTSNSVHFYNWYEFYIGSFVPRRRIANGKVLLAQVHAYDDPAHRLRLARGFTLGSVRNMRRLLARGGPAVGEWHGV